MDSTAFGHQQIHTWCSCSFLGFFRLSVPSVDHVVSTQESGPHTCAWQETSLISATEGKTHEMQCGYIYAEEDTIYCYSSINGHR
jgi:hypothetical protein